jgi:hypothetical protein
MVAVHAGETLINWPSPPTVVLTDRRRSTSMPQMLQSAQVDTGALPRLTAPSRPQQGQRLLEASRKPVELASAPIFGSFFGSIAEPAPMNLRIEIERKSSANPPKTTRRMFTLTCPLLLPTIAAGKISNEKGFEIGRMQDNYEKRAECLVSAKRATTIAKRRIGCRCTAVMKEIDSAAQASPGPAFGPQLP